MIICSFKWEAVLIEARVDQSPKEILNITSPRWPMQVRLVRSGALQKSGVHLETICFLLPLTKWKRSSPWKSQCLSMPLGRNPGSVIWNSFQNTANLCMWAQPQSWSASPSFVKAGNEENGEMGGEPRSPSQGYFLALRSQKLPFICVTESSTLRKPG